MIKLKIDFTAIEFTNTVLHFQCECKKLNFEISNAVQKLRQK